MLQFFAAALILMSTALSGTIFPHGMIAVLTLGLSGWILSGRGMTPRFLNSPTKMISAFGAVLTFPVVALIGSLGAAYILMLIDRALPVLALAPLVPLMLYTSTFMLPIAAIIPSTKKEAELQKREISAMRATPDAIPKISRWIATAHWIALRLAAGLLIVPVGYLFAWYWNGDVRALDYILASRRTLAFLFAMSTLIAALAAPVHASIANGDLFSATEPILDH